MGMPVIIHSDTDRCDAITDIIQSVALEQAALSHILNAEGEKLQAIFDEKNKATIDQMLEANKSVQKMVETVTRLEMVLQSKLGLFDECLCTECKKTETNTNEEKPDTET